MKKILVLLFVILFAASVPAQSGRKIKTPPPTPAEPTVVEPPAPQSRTQPIPPKEFLSLPPSFINRRIQMLDNGSLRLADYDKKVIVINLWATWCGPCRMEVPDYEEVRKEYDGHNIEFIALTTENPNTSSDRVKKFVRDYRFGFRVGWADRETAVTLMNGSSAIPQTIIIAPGGRIFAYWRGYAGNGQSANRLRRALDSILSE